MKSAIEIFACIEIALGIVCVLRPDAVYAVIKRIWK